LGAHGADANIADRVSAQTCTFTMVVTGTVITRYGPVTKKIYAAMDVFNPTARVQGVNGLQITYWREM
jgi:hypothetical protein